MGKEEVEEIDVWETKRANRWDIDDPLAIPRELAKPSSGDSMEDSLSINLEESEEIVDDDNVEGPPRVPSFQDDSHSFTPPPGTVPRFSVESNSNVPPGTVPRFSVTNSDDKRLGEASHSNSIPQFKRSVTPPTKNRSSSKSSEEDKRSLTPPKRDISSANKDSSEDNSKSEEGKPKKRKKKQRSRKKKRKRHKPNEPDENGISK